MESRVVIIFSPPGTKRQTLRWRISAVNLDGDGGKPVISDDAEHVYCAGQYGIGHGILRLILVNKIRTKSFLSSNGLKANPEQRKPEEAECKCRRIVFSPNFSGVRCWTLLDPSRCRAMRLT